MSREQRLFSLGLTKLSSALKHPSTVVQLLGHLSRSVSDARVAERCSPPSVTFPLRSRLQLTPLCSVGSQVPRMTAYRVIAHSTRSRASVRRSDSSDEASLGEPASRNASEPDPASSGVPEGGQSSPVDEA
jgi:hypothetical protein